MASTYSSLKIELIGTGEQSGTWGTTTNANLGTAIEEAITGSATVSFSGVDVTLTLTDTNTTQAARNLRLNLTGTSGGARNLVVPAIEKVYIVNNGLADAVTVTASGGTGIAVPAGKSMYLYNDGTNVVNAITHLNSLTLDTDLAVADGGTGASDAGTARTNLGLGTMATQASSSVTITGGAISNTTITGGSISGITDLAVADGGTGASDASTARVNLGAATRGANSDITSLSGLTSALSVSQGGTGVATLSGVLKGNGTSAISAATAGSDYAKPDTVSTWTAGQRGSITVLTDGATITPNFASSNNFKVTLAGNRTLANPTNLVAGQSGSIFIIQDGTGSRTLTYGAYWTFPNGRVPNLTSTPAATDRIDYIVLDSTKIQAVFTRDYS